MSLWREYLDEYAFEMYNNMKYGIWTTKDGTEIDVTDMTTRHIKNCMRIVGKKSEWYWIFEEELKRRDAE